MQTVHSSSFVIFLQKEQNQSDKLNSFLRDCLTLGCLKCFQYFEFYPRGREELAITLKYCESGQTKRTSIPTGSPTTRDSEPSQDLTFLIGGYAKYKCPYVWARSNHPKITKLLSGRSPQEAPLELNTTTKWKTEIIKVWNIIEELVQIFYTPVPKNPFKIDFEKLEGLSSVEIYFSSASLANFLKKIYIRNPIYSSEIASDIERLLKLHFESLPNVVPH